MGAGTIVESSAATETATTTTNSETTTNTSHTNTKQAVSARLLRRSTALDHILRAHSARDLVTPLGETLFALDVLVE